ncbi:MAG: M56 family metallopeptidase [Ilumatobacteraceae bacterium]
MVLPLIAAMVTMMVGGPLVDRLAPASAVRWNALLLSAVVAAAVPTFWMVGLSGLAHLGVRSSVFDWSMHLLPDHPLVSVAIGVSSLTLAVVGTVRVVGVLRAYAGARCAETCPFHLVDSPEVFAYTLPGPARTIAVSRGLRDSLDDREFDIVLAHERAHADHRHDRYLLLANVATAVLPVVHAAGRRLQFHLERWADEIAVGSTGGDRRLAARTIAKVALVQSISPAMLGIASHGVAARAGALITPPLAPTMTRRVLVGVAVAVTVSLSIGQLHHTAEFALSMI